MPMYTWRGRNSRGEVVQGQLDGGAHDGRALAGVIAHLEHAVHHAEPEVGRPADLADEVAHTGVGHAQVGHDLGQRQRMVAWFFGVGRQGLDGSHDSGIYQYSMIYGRLCE